MLLAAEPLGSMGERLWATHGPACTPKDPSCDLWNGVATLFRFESIKLSGKNEGRGRQL
jgi:hypothetical protein